MQVWRSRLPAHRSLCTHLRGWARFVDFEREFRENEALRLHQQRLLRRLPPALSAPPPAPDEDDAVVVGAVEVSPVRLQLLDLSCLCSVLLLLLRERRGARGAWTELKFAPAPCPHGVLLLLPPHTFEGGQCAVPPLRIREAACQQAASCLYQQLSRAASPSAQQDCRFHTRHLVVEPQRECHVHGLTDRSDFCSSSSSSSSSPINCDSNSPINCNTSTSDRHARVDDEYSKVSA